MWTWCNGGGDLRDPEETEGEGESFLLPAEGMEGEAASLSDDDLFNPGVADEADDTVVAVLNEAMEDDGIIGDDNDFSEDTPLGDLIALSCNSWILWL